MSLSASLHAVRLPFCLAPSLGLAACGPGEPPTATPNGALRASAAPSEVASAPAAPGVSSAAPDAPAPPRADPEAFAWRGPSPESGGVRADRAEIQAGSLRCVFHRDDERRQRHLECVDGGNKRVWGYDDRSVSLDSGTLASDGKRLFFCAFNVATDGAEVTAFDLGSGERLWQVSTLGLGPVAHSEYLNHTQVGIAGDEVEVLGWESSGRYIERLDAATGVRRVTMRLLPEGRTQRIGADLAKAPDPGAPKFGAASSYPWKWDGPASLDAYQAARVEIEGGGACAFKSDPKESRTTFECTRGKDRLFGFDLATNLQGGALAADKQRVYLVRFPLISSGATAYAYDIKNGRELWRRTLAGLGPIDHSKYFNKVRVRLDYQLLVVTGWEAAGKYIEVLEVAAGKDMGNRVEPGP